MVNVRRLLASLVVRSTVALSLAICSVAPSRAQAACTCQACAAPKWHAVETANFRILNYGGHPLGGQVGEACEAMRKGLCQCWLGLQSENWSPKCDIILYPTDEAYLREVGAGARDTVASSLIDRRQGRIASRRIDIRASRADWQSNALGHEMTHVVLADRFAAEPLPRWMDEGMAILADSAEKQGLHRTDLTRAVAAKREFRVHELITMGDYPPSNRWATFYGQSASLVRFLVDQAGAERFVQFAELASRVGYETALKRTYHFGVAELERRWQASLARPTERQVVEELPTNGPSTVGSPAAVPVALGRS